jgi:predicted RND superfamily exporter protein
MGWFGIPIQSGKHHDAAAGHRHRRDERHSHPESLCRGTHAGILSRSTGKAVLVSGLTAIAGFGSLILAKHRGIHSLGCVMATWALRRA